jgi:hypothetical protein
MIGWPKIAKVDDLRRDVDGLGDVEVDGSYHVDEEVVLERWQTLEHVGVVRVRDAPLYGRVDASSHG